MWKMIKNHPEATAEYPFAIVQKGRVVALVKRERDARFIAKSEGRIHDLETDCSSLTLQKYGKNITERKVS
jgi:hypothetical protein